MANNKKSTEITEEMIEEMKAKITSKVKDSGVPTPLAEKEAEVVQEESASSFVNANVLHNEVQRQVLEKLDLERKVSIRIPQVAGEEHNKNATLEVRINGVSFSYRRGMRYELPETIVNLIETAHDLTREASVKWSVDRNQEVANAVRG